ncbi:MAG: hypothetical protein V4753_01930 [Pseudomonadota bacterium]
MSRACATQGNVRVTIGVNIRVMWKRSVNAAAPDSDKATRGVGAGPDPRRAPG